MVNQFNAEAFRASPTAEAFRASPTVEAVRASPTVPFAPDVPPGLPQGFREPLLNDPWNAWLQRQGIPPYVGELASWTGLGSNSFPREIMSSLREGRAISFERLSGSQVTRSVRLFSILKMVFEQHPRASLILRNYEEGLGRVKVSGFEALRLLAREFGIKTRTELMYFRQQVVNGNFFSRGSTIPEIVRKVQFEIQFEIL